MPPFLVEIAIEPKSRHDIEPKSKRDFSDFEVALNRLVAEDEGAHSDDEEDLVATDVGIDGGAASAEEAAIHVVEDDDTDIRSGD